MIFGRPEPPFSDLRASWGVLGTKKYKKSPQNHQKSNPRPPKIDAKMVLNEIHKQGCMHIHSWGAPPEFLDRIWRQFGASWAPRWPQDGPKLEAKTEPKSIKNRCRKR